MAGYNDKKAVWENVRSEHDKIVSTDIAHPYSKLPIQ